MGECILKSFVFKHQKEDGYSKKFVVNVDPRWAIYPKELSDPQQLIIARNYDFFLKFVPESLGDKLLLILNNDVNFNNMTDEVFRNMLENEEIVVAPVAECKKV